MSNPLSFVPPSQIIMSEKKMLPLLWTHKMWILRLIYNGVMQPNLLQCCQCMPYLSSSQYGAWWRRREVRAIQEVLWLLQQQQQNIRVSTGHSVQYRYNRSHPTTGATPGTTRNYTCCNTARARKEEVSIAQETQVCKIHRCPAMVTLYMYNLIQHIVSTRKDVYSVENIVLFGSTCNFPKFFQSML